MKDFLLIGPGNALGYHTLFPLFVDKAINACPIICKKEGIEIRFEDQYVTSNYFKCTPDSILAAANTNTKLYGFQVFRIKVDEKIASYTNSNGTPGTTRRSKTNN